MTDNTVKEVGNQSTSMPGPEREFTTEDVLTYLENGGRPAYSVANVADFFDVTRPPAQDRLEELAESGEVTFVTIGGTKAYFVPGEGGAPQDPVDSDLDREQYHRRSLRHWAEDRFVGLQTSPWTAVHPNDGPAEAGDRVQIRVEGVPGRWGHSMTHKWENRREQLHPEELIADETQALLSGELYAKPTVPIEHTEYPDDYDLELNIGGEYQDVEGRSQPILIVPGVKNYLVKPCDDAVFLTDVSVDWISVQGEGAELQTTEITTDMIEDVEEWRQENVDFEPEDDVVPLSEDCEPYAAYVEPYPKEGAAFRVVPVDEEGQELGEEYEPTDQFRREVKRNGSYGAELKFERDWPLAGQVPDSYMDVGDSGE